MSWQCAQYRSFMVAVWRGLTNAAGWPLVARGDQLEEQIRCFGFERDVADLVDDEQRVAAEADELGLQAAGVVGGGEAGRPIRRRWRR